MPLSPGNYTSYNVAPGSEDSVRRKVAAALMLQGSSSEPVQHWTQGAARIAQALTGGFMAHEADAADEADKAESRRIINELMGGGQQPAGAPTPGMLPPPVSAPRSPSFSPVMQAPPEQPSPYKVAGMAPANSQDTFRTPLDVMAPRPQVATALQNAYGVPAPQPALSSPTSPATAAASGPPTMVPASAMSPAPMANNPPNPMRGGMSPERRAQLISSLMSTKFGAAMGEKLFAGELQNEQNNVRPMTPQERQAWQVPENMSAGIDKTGKPTFSPPQTNIALNTTQKGQEVMATKAAEDFQTANQGAREAQKRVATWNAMEQAAKGFEPGATAELKLGAKKYLKDFGLIEGADVPDAQVFQVLQKQLQIHAQPKGQGSVSNFERELFSQSIANMKMDPAALSRSIQIARKLDQFDQKVARVYRDNARTNKGVPDSVTVNDEIDKLGSPLDEADMQFLNRAKAGVTSAPATQSAPAGKIKIDANGNVIQQ